MFRNLSDTGARIASEHTKFDQTLLRALEHVQFCRSHLRQTVATQVAVADLHVVVVFFSDSQAQLQLARDACTGACACAQQRATAHSTRIDATHNV